MSENKYLPLKNNLTTRILHSTRQFVITMMTLTTLVLAGCKIDLYSNLPESEANQMLALLMLRNIEADKKIVKDSNVTIRVDKAQFVDAIEVLRQNGFPQKITATMDDLFPSGQLVTSPAQEIAKITYLKEQQLEKMLLEMDGIISAQVSIAEGVSQNRRDIPIPSASIFIKHSPDRNYANHETDIKSLVQKAISNLRAENISVILQPADYRYQLPLPVSKKTGERSWFSNNRSFLILLLFLVVSGLLAAVGIWTIRRKATASTLIAKATETAQTLTTANK